MMASDLVLALGLLGIFLAIALAVTTMGAMRSERVALARSLSAVDAISSMLATGAAVEVEVPFRDRVLRPVLGQSAALGRRLTPSVQAARLARRLELAGSPPGWDVDRILALRILAIVMLPMAGMVVALILRAPLLVVPGVGLVGAVAGFFLPTIVLSNLADRRAEAIQQALPNALDLLTISVEAGLPFDSAMAQVARNTKGPLAEELYRVLQETQIGLSRADAIRAMAYRTPVEDLKTLCGAMVQADQFGIPIANVLRVQAREMRIKRRQRAEATAQRLPVKILFPLIFCILPPLFVVILGPAILQILDLLAGQSLP